MKAARVKSDKLLIAVPFWNGDKVAAMALARLIADIEPEHCQLADFLFVARFDCEHDETVIRQVSRRFNVHTHTSSRRETGWPAGCNGLFFGTMEFVYHKMNNESIPWYKAILICEADTVPLTKDWILCLSREWDRINKTRTTRIAGALVGGGVFGKAHINGGCILLSGEIKFQSWLNDAATSYTAIAGWDWTLAEDFQAWGWSDMPMMKSQWNQPSISLADVVALQASGVALLHGIKDDSLLKISRTLLVNT